MQRYLHPFHRRLTGAAVALAGSLSVYGCSTPTAPGYPAHPAATPSALPSEQQQALSTLDNQMTGVKNGILHDAGKQASGVKAGEFGASNTEAMNANNGKLINEKFPQIILNYSAPNSQVVLTEQDPYIDYASGVAAPKVFAGIVIVYQVTQPNVMDTKLNTRKPLEVGDFSQVLASGARFVSATAETGRPDVKQYLNENPDGTFTFSQVAADPSNPAAVATVAPAPDLSTVASNMQSLQSSLSAEIH